MTPDAAGVTEVAVKGWTWTATLVAVLNLIVGAPSWHGSSRVRGCASWKSNRKRSCETT